MRAVTSLSAQPKQIHSEFFSSLSLHFRHWRFLFWKGKSEVKRKVRKEKVLFLIFYYIVYLWIGQILYRVVDESRASPIGHNSTKTLEILSMTLETEKMPSLLLLLPLDATAGWSIIRTILSDFNFMSIKMIMIKNMKKKTSTMTTTTNIESI